MPSAQGWTYVDGGIASLAEANAFSVDGTKLTLNTIGDGQVAVLYRLDNAVDPLLPYSLSLRARAIQNEPLGNVSTFFFSVDTSIEAISFVIQPDRIEFLGGQVLLDGTQFHDYRFEVIPGIGAELFVDEILVLQRDFPTER